ncbi:SdpC family antimicrobial peptide [Rhodococcus sp. OK611]|nr:SdpC family antimicrobial peptide [Rhodococcus sp. OK611]SNX92769.1 antimicrobial peptide, SdpC family [Rhodococcus sp. OK270]
MTRIAGTADDGKTIFNAVAFAKGPLTSLIFKGQEQGGPIPVTAQQLAASDAVVEAINSTSPGYFSAFSTKMRSGNPLVVQAALDSASAELGSQGVTPLTTVTPNGVQIDTNLYLNSNAAWNVNAALDTNLAWNQNAVFAGSSGGGVAPLQAIAELTQVLKNA